MGIEQYLPIRQQSEINPQKPGDYMQDGILHCGVCGQAKQFHIKCQGLDTIVPAACKCTQEAAQKRRQEEQQQETRRRIDRLRQNSMMSSSLAAASFKSYIHRPENKAAYNLAAAYCRKWPQMKAENQGILFYGPVGTGKSYTAACIANYLMACQIPVIMTSFVKILQDIRNTPNETVYLDTLNSASLLIIDDLGAERSTDYAIEKVYNIIDSRVRTNLPMILTTNLSLEDITTAADIRYKRIYDRILEHCYPQQIAGNSLRLNEAERRFDHMKEILGGTP